MDLKEAISESVRRVLPHLPDDQVNGTVDFVIKEGVKKLSDLRHITVSMLKSVLDTIDSCDLNNYWQDKYNAPGPSGTSSSSAAVAASRASSSADVAASRASSSADDAASSRQPLQLIAANVVNPAPPTFDLNSPYMPSSVKDAVKAKKRPTTSAREKFVERIVDRCRETIPNLQRTVFKTIGIKIVTMYPESFKDRFPVHDHGADSFIAQLKNKFDNDNRPKGKKTAKELEVPSCKQAFGCISWNPPLPPNQTLELQVAARNNLKVIHRLSWREWDWRTIKLKLEESFYLQRRDINGTLVPKQKKNKNREEDEARVDEPEDLSIVEINTKWPFLFTSKGINYHFQLLTGVDFKEKLSDFVRETVPDLIEFLTGGGNDELKMLKRRIIKAEKQGHGSTNLCGILLMLIVYFKDSRDEFLTFVEETTTLDEAKELESIQYPKENTPFLIFAGTSIYEFETIFFAADGKVLSTVRSVFDAVVLFFTSFYTFNYMYSTNLSSFLLFMQRNIAGIESVSNGSKCKNAQVFKKSNGKISQLCIKFEEARERWRHEDSKEN